MAADKPASEDFVRLSPSLFVHTRVEITSLIRLTSQHKIADLLPSSGANQNS
jgi:hypothetical protein